MNKVRDGGDFTFRKLTLLVVDKDWNTLKFIVYVLLCVT